MLTKVHSSERRQGLSDVHTHSSPVIYKSDMAEMEIYITRTLTLFTKLLSAKVRLPNETHLEVFLAHYARWAAVWCTLDSVMTESHQVFQSSECVWCYLAQQYVNHLFSSKIKSLRWCVDMSARWATKNKIWLQYVDDFLKREYSRHPYANVFRW